METQINCPPEPYLREKLKETLEAMPEETARLLIDFSQVSIVTGSSISKLLRLRRVLEGRKGKLVLRNVSSKTRNIFKTTGLEGAFNFFNE